MRLLKNISLTLFISILILTSGSQILTGDTDSNIDGADGQTGHFPDESRIDKDPIRSIENETGVVNPTRGSSARTLFDVEIEITYAIISPELFYDQLIPFRDWKIKKGVSAHIFVLEEIYKDYSGVLKSSKIHNFLQELKEKYPTVKWLLLVGDSEWIPAPKIRADIDGDLVPDEFQDFAFSDYYYAGLDTDWDHDGDGIYGEVLEDYDWSAELYVGRFPVSTRENLTVILDKIYDYERNPAEDGWYHNIILAGAVMDINTGPNIPDDPYTAEDDGYNDYKDNAKKVNDKIKDLFSQNYLFLEFYDYYKLEPGFYSQFGDTLNHDNVVNAFNQGASIVNLVSHGYDNGDGHVAYAGDGDYVFWETFFDYTDAESATNGHKLPFVYSSSCTSGNFTEINDTGLERLLTASGGGAIGFVGATVTTYRGEFRENNTSFGNWWMNENFFKMFTAGDHKPGRVLYRMKEAYEEHIRDSSNPHGGENELDYQQMFRINLLAYNYLGDPELSIWTRSPDQLDVEFNETFLPPFRDSHYTVKVKDKATGTAVKNALVAITGPSQYGTMFTDKYGTVEMPLKITPKMRYNLTITADDYAPFEGHFDIHAGTNVKVSMADLSADTTKLREGARTNITLMFRNDGKITAPVVELGFYDGVPDSHNLIGQLYRFENVRPNDVRQIAVPYTMTTGVHNIYAMLDPYNKLLELDETDNSAYITISENKPPIIFDFPLIPVDEDESVQNAIQLSSYVWDSDPGDTLTFKILSTSELSCSVVIDGNNYIDIDPDPDWFGVCNISIEISDGIDSTVTYLLVEVASINDAPVLKTVQNQTLLEDQWFELILFGYDHADTDDRIRYETDLFEVFPELGKNIDIFFDGDSGHLRMKPVNSNVGKHEVNFRAVDDKGGASSWQKVSFDIKNVNDPPVVRIDKDLYSVKVGEQFFLDVRVYDVDVNDTIVYWDDTDLFDIDPVTGEIDFEPQAADAGNHQITVFVSDGQATVEKTFNLTVEKGLETVKQYLYLGIIIVGLGVLFGALAIFVHQKRRRKGSFKDNDSPDKSEPGIRDLDGRTDPEVKRSDMKKGKDKDFEKGKAQDEGPEADTDSKLEDTKPRKPKVGEKKGSEIKAKVKSGAKEKKLKTED